MQILVAGASTFGVKNTGDDAMFQVLCSELKNKIPGLKIIFLARHPDKKFDKYFGIRSIKNIEFYNNKSSVGKRFFGFNPTDSKDHFKKIISEIKKSDLIIIGGNSFMEYSENEFLRGVTSYSSFIATLAILHDKPYVLYGVNGHSIKNKLTKQMAKFLCENAQLVGIRDNPFKLELLKLGIKPDNLKVFTDPTFGLKPIKNQILGKQLLQNENIPKNSKLVGICYRRLYSKWTDKEFDKHASKVASFCDHIIKKLGFQILFIPNCIYQDGHIDEDDRRISEYIKNKMKEKNSAYVIMSDLNVDERLSIFSMLDFVITNRRHVTIFAAIHHIPFLTLGHEFTWHFESFMNDLKSNNYFLNVRNDDLKSINKKIENLINSKDKISKNLK